MPKHPEKPTPEHRPGDQGRSTIPFSDFDRPPERIGPYRIHEVLGRGGMGIVYRAEQDAPIRREVAVKLVRRTLLSDYEIEVGGGLGALAGEIWRIGLMGENARRENVARLLDALKKELH